LAKKKLEIDWKFLRKYLFADIARMLHSRATRRRLVIARKTANCFARSLLSWFTFLILFL